MSIFQIRRGTIEDENQIISLNAESVAVTSPMDSERFRYLFDRASLVTVAEMDGKVVAFLMAMTEGANYENANYLWFEQRLRKFIYIDRVVVSAGSRSKGIGSSLYENAISSAKEKGLLSVVAEIDVDPPNEVSLNFHKNRGFVKIGTRELDSSKTVAMQMKSM